MSTTKPKNEDAQPEAWDWAIREASRQIAAAERRIQGLRRTAAYCEQQKADGAPFIDEIVADLRPATRK